MKTLRYLIPKITLAYTLTGWVATFHDDPSIIEAFGCDTVPTAFDRTCPEPIAIAAMRAINPNCDIEVKCDCI